MVASFIKHYIHVKSVKTLSKVIFKVFNYVNIEIYVKHLFLLSLLAEIKYRIIYKAIPHRLFFFAFFNNVVLYYFGTQSSGKFYGDVCACSEISCNKTIATL